MERLFERFRRRGDRLALGSLFDGTAPGPLRHRAFLRNLAAETPRTGPCYTRRGGWFSAMKRGR